METKTCLMCRSEIDVKALVCPNCNTNVNYVYFQEIPANQLIQPHKLSNNNMTSMLISAVAGAAFFYIGLGFYNFLVGGMAALLVGGGTRLWMNKVFRVRDKVNFTCACGHPFEASWEHGVLKAGALADINCPLCHQKTRLIIRG